jgi:hypothetical protein
VIVTKILYRKYGQTDGQTEGNLSFPPPFVTGRTINMIRTHMNPYHDITAEISTAKLFAKQFAIIILEHYMDLSIYLM